MKRVRLSGKAHWAAALFVLTVAACTTPPTVVEDDLLPPQLPQRWATYTTAGPTEFTAEPGSMTSETGCEIAYTHFLPGGRATGDDPLLVLAHGFLRSRENMRGWAELFASHGVRTVTASFCNSSLFNGDHAQNALDLRALADELAGPATPILYAGYSAGGLSAMLAAAQDERTFGYLGIDPVDSDGMLAAVGSLRAPAFYLLGEPNPCNRDGATRSLLPNGSPAWLIEIPYATHCTFEDPTDSLCIHLCGTVSPEESNEQLRQTVQALGTAFVVAQFGTDPGAMSLMSIRELRRLEAAGSLRIITPMP